MALPRLFLIWLVTSKTFYIAKLPTPVSGCSLHWLVFRGRGSRQCRMRCCRSLLDAVSAMSQLYRWSVRIEVIQ